MDPEWRCVNFPMVKNGGYPCVMMVYQSAFIPIFSNKKRPRDSTVSALGFSRFSNGAARKRLPPSPCCRSSNWKRPFRVVDDAWGSGNSLCYLVVFGKIKKFLDLWGGVAQFPWKGVNFVVFFSPVLPFYQKNTVFVRAILKKTHFILCNMRSTKDEETTLQSYSVVAQIWSMLWVWC